VSLVYKDHNVGLLWIFVVLSGGPAGIGKTTLAKTFTLAIGGDFRRVQMTPDLLPADVLGVNVFNQRSGEWELKHGPIFCNVG